MILKGEKENMSALHLLINVKLKKGWQASKLHWATPTENGHYFFFFSVDTFELKKNEWMLGTCFHCTWHSLKQQGEDFTIRFCYKVA